MVPRDAHLHPLLDDRHRPRQRPSAMPHNNALSTILQFPHRLRAEPILASPNHIPILRAPVTRSIVPRLLPAALLAVTRGVLRTLAGAFLVVVGLCDGGVVGLFAVYGDAVFGECAVEYAGVYLVEAESGY